MKGVKVVSLACRNDRCTWFNTNWIVQVNSDGSIPDPGMRGEKQFPAMDAMREARGRRQLEQLAIEDPAAARDVFDLFDKEGN
jgi:hypothetical protein